MVTEIESKLPEITVPKCDLESVNASIHALFCQNNKKSQKSYKPYSFCLRRDDDWRRKT